MSANLFSSDKSFEEISNLKNDVATAMQAVGDQASPLMVRIGEFFSSISEAPQVDQSTVSNEQLQQALRDIFGMSGKEAKLRIEMMERAKAWAIQPYRLSKVR